MPSEWLLYKFYIKNAQEFDFRVRASADADTDTDAVSVQIKMIVIPDDDVVKQESISKQFSVPTKDFEDFLWENVTLSPGHYGLQILFVTGQVNLCSTAVLVSGSPATIPLQVSPKLGGQCI